MKKFIKDFGTFIKRGNVLDLAIGMIIGTAFNTIVKSLVNDIIMPIIGVILKVNVVELRAVLVPEVLNEAGEIIRNAVTINYGSFLQSVIDFLVIALSVFVAIRTITSVNTRIERLKVLISKQEEVVEEKVEEHVVVEVKPSVEELLTDIKEILKSNKE